MYKKFIELLRMLTDEMEMKDDYMKEILLQVNSGNIDLYRVNDELLMLEKSSLIEPEEIDFLKSVLVYLFMKNTELDVEDIYAIVFGNGKRINWQ